MAKSTEERINELLDRLEISTLTSSEIDIIERKIELLKSHG